MAADMINLVAQAATPSPWVDTPVLRDVPDAEAARFTDVLQAPQAAQGIQAPSDVPEVYSVSPGQPGHLGDAILRSMEEVGRQYAAKTQEIHQVFLDRSQELSTTSLLRLQVQLTDASMFVDLLGKAVSKATQHIDQLTKLQ
jgi:type III secretion system YscI/HrpB-like protein